MGCFRNRNLFLFGIILALLINTKGLKYKAFWRTIFVITMAVPPFVSLLIMRNLLNGSGPINALLLNWGLIDSSIPFLTDPNWAKLTIIVVNMWIGIPATMLISTGIIQNLPEDQIEAARIDGANKWQIFKSITFPQILFVMTPALIQQFIGNINNFNVIYLLTGGGPANSNFYGAGSTDLLVTWLYKLTVDTMDYNLASVIGILIFILSAVFSLIAYTRTNYLRRRNLWLKQKLPEKQRTALTSVYIILTILAVFDVPHCVDYLNKFSWRRRCICSLYHSQNIHFRKL